MEKVKVAAETDTKRLANYVCGSNIYLEGEDVKVSGTLLLNLFLFKSIHFVNLKFFL